jgi:hypothetical protein
MSSIPTPKMAKSRPRQEAMQNRSERDELYDESKKFGKVDEEGNVYLLTDGTEKYIGQYVGDDLDNAMDIYIERYLDILSLFDAFQTRLKNAVVSDRDIERSLKDLARAIKNPICIGDMSVLPQKLAEVKEFAASQKEFYAKERRNMKERAIRVKESIVRQAESLAKRKIARTQWKPLSEQMNGLIDAWRDTQDESRQIPDSLQEKLWDRLFEARKEFEKRRREFFKELDELSEEAKHKKEALIEQAEKLAKSTDWDDTAKKFADLMTKWKKAGHARYREDDELWRQFKEAQNMFFDAKDLADEEMADEWSANLEKRNALIKEARKLLPVKNARIAREKFRAIQQKWDETGKVSRADVAKTENAILDVDKAIKKAEQNEWEETNPEYIARANSITTQLNDAIQSLEAKIKDEKDKSRVKKLQDELDGKKALLKALTA